jgi:thiol:disulfide interchange protein DsbC
MRTRTSEIAASALLALMVCGSPGFAQTAEPMPEERVLTKLRALYPGTAFSRVQSTPVPGLYEVALGNNVAYVAEDGRYVVFGHLFDLQTQRDLTATQLVLHPGLDFAALPLADAIKTVRGSGQRQLAVFSDPDCPYCRELEAQLVQLEDATIYTFLLPLASLHPQATRKAIAVWCMQDRARAWREVVLAHKTLPPRSCANPIERNLALANRLQVRGTPTLIAGDGRMATGVMSSAELTAWLDARSNSNSVAVPSEGRR